MPNFDGTGPQGAGPQTGRGAGTCEDSRRAGFLRRFGRGRGFSRVRGNVARPMRGRNRRADTD